MDNLDINVGEIARTSNDVRERSGKMKLGRLVALMKMFAGFLQSDIMLDGLVTLAELTEALMDEGKVDKYLFLGLLFVIHFCSHLTFWYQPHTSGSFK